LRNISETHAATCWQKLAADLQTFLPKKLYQSKKEFKGEIMNLQEVGNVVGAKDYFFTLKVDVHEPNSTTTTTTTPPTTTTAPPEEVIF
jgi:hypothetical protein